MGNVYKCINAVQKEINKTGIAKDRTAGAGGGTSYKFRGIDDVYNALSPLLADAGLCILPRMVSRECVERTSSSNRAIFYVTVEAEFDFVCAEDGSTHTIKTFGEAMDSGDKATNKAMSAAYKYAAFQAFAIPTEGDNDSENAAHEVTSRPANKPAVIGPLEFKKLTEALDETGSDKVAFCAACKINSLSEMPMDMYERALAKINAKKQLADNNMEQK